MNAKELGKIIRGVREQRGEDQESFGAVIGGSRRSISRWESGDGLPRPEIIASFARVVQQRDEALAQRIAKAFGVEAIVPARPTQAPAPTLSPDRACERALLLACDALDAPPKKVRVALALALGELRAAQMTVEAAYAAFAAKGEK